MKKKIIKFIHCMMFCTCMAIFLNQLVLCINKYLKNESSIEVLMERYATPEKSFQCLIQLITEIHDFSTQWAEIPTLSICPSFDSAFKKTVLAWILYVHFYKNSVYKKLLKNTFQRRNSFPKSNNNNLTHHPR